MGIEKAPFWLFPSCPGIQCIRVQRFKDTWGISPLGWGSWTFSPTLSLGKPWPLTPQLALCYLHCHPPSGGAIRWSTWKGYLEVKGHGDLCILGEARNAGHLWGFLALFHGPYRCLWLSLSLFSSLIGYAVPGGSSSCSSPSPNKTQKILSLLQCWRVVEESS